MKELIKIFNIFLLYLITLTKADICQEGYISISPLGKCVKIKDFLEDKTLSIKTMNLFYLAINNEKKIDVKSYNYKWQELIDSLLQTDYNKRADIKKVFLLK